MVPRIPVLKWSHLGLWTPAATHMASARDPRLLVCYGCVSPAGLIAGTSSWQPCQDLSQPCQAPVFSLYRWLGVTFWTVFPVKDPPHTQPRLWPSGLLGEVGHRSWLAVTRTLFAKRDFSSLNGCGSGTQSRELLDPSWTQGIRLTTTQRHTKTFKTFEGLPAWDLEAACTAPGQQEAERLARFSGSPDGQSKFSWEQISFRNSGLSPNPTLPYIFLGTIAAVGVSIGHCPAPAPFLPEGVWPLAWGRLGLGLWAVDHSAPSFPLAISHSVPQL